MSQLYASLLVVYAALAITIALISVLDKVATQPRIQTKGDAILSVTFALLLMLGGLFWPIYYPYRIARWFWRLPRE